MTDGHLPPPPDDVEIESQATAAVWLDQAAAAPLTRGGTLLFGYSGTSMIPTFHDLDLLEVAPYDGAPVTPGDVIVFQPPERDHQVVHRVVAVGPDGIRTRGDNCLSDDLWLLHPADITGRVVTARRRGTRRPVAGGRAGVLASYALRWRRLLARALKPLLRPLYHATIYSGVLRPLLPRSLRPRVVTFYAGGRAYPKLLLGNLAVGRYDYRRGQWMIQRPWRLFVDERVLPGGDDLGERGGSHETERSG